jgi:hypothetical protein
MPHDCSELPDANLFLPIANPPFGSQTAGVPDEQDGPDRIVASDEMGTCIRYEPDICKPGCSFLAIHVLLSSAAGTPSSLARAAFQFNLLFSFSGESHIHS